MPAPTTPIAPPAVPSTAVAPTPQGEYTLSQHPPTPGRPQNNAITEALNRRAGVAPAKESGEPRTIPGQPPRPTEKPQQPSTEKPTAPAPTKFVPADDQEPTPKAAAAPEAPKVPGEPSPEIIKSAPAQLREAYERLKTDFTAQATEGTLTKKQLAEFQAKAKSYEDRIKSLESADARAKELEKQVLTYDEQLRVTNYLQHPEFHEKYVRPVAEAMQQGHALTKELITSDEQGNQRYGTEDDFAAVLAQPNYSLMDKKAVELFGERMSVHIVEQAKKVRELQSSQSKAMKEAGLRSQQWLKDQQDRAAQARTTARERFENASKELADKYPQLYRPPEGDNDALAARKSGEELARLILDGQPPEMPAEQYLSAVAKVYHRAASFPMRELAISRLQTEVESLRSKLAAYEKSSPDTSSRQQPAGVTDAGGTIVTAANDLSAKMRASLERRAGVRR